MAVLLKTASVRVSSIQIMQVRVQNKGKSVWKSRYDGDVSCRATLAGTIHPPYTFLKTATIPTYYGISIAIPRYITMQLSTVPFI